MAQEVHIVLLSNDPARAYPALMLALGAVAKGLKTEIYFAMKGLDIVRKGKAKKITMPGAPPLGQFLDDAKKLGVKLCACAPSRQMLEQMGISGQTVEGGVKLEDMMGFLERALPAAKEGGLVLFI